MQIVAAQKARYIQQFASDEQARTKTALHGLRVYFAGLHTAAAGFRLFESCGPYRQKAMSVYRLH